MEEAESGGRLKAFLGRHTVFVMFLLSLGAVLALSLYTGIILRDYMKDQERAFVERITRQAVSLAAMTTGDELARYRVPGDVKLPEYGALKARLAEFGRRTDALYVYYFRIQPGGKIRYIVDNDYDERTRVGLDTSLVDLADETGAEATWERGEVVCEGIGVYVEGWEGIASAYAPVRRSDGGIEAVAGVDLDDRFLRLANSRMMLFMSIQILAVLLVSACGLASILSSRTSARRAEAAMRAKSSFLARMSHEIRTPMAAVVGLAELAQREYGAPKALERINGVAKAGAGLIAVIDDILDITKVEQGTVALKSYRYATAALLADSAAVARVRIGERPVELVVRACPDLPGTLFGDGGRVKQILLNLLHNAVKFTPRGCVKLTVMFTVLDGPEGTETRLEASGAPAPRITGDFHTGPELTCAEGAPDGQVPPGGRDLAGSEGAPEGQGAPGGRELAGSWGAPDEQVPPGGRDLAGAEGAKEGQVAPVGRELAGSEGAPEGLGAPGGVELAGAEGAPKGQAPPESRGLERASDVTEGGDGPVMPSARGGCRGTASKEAVRSSFARGADQDGADSMGSVRLTFRVEDTGVGISPSDMKRIFKEFSRGDSPGTHGVEGTGLGLAIARSLARSMGGDITASSELGKGSVFTAEIVQKAVDPTPMGELDTVPAASSMIAKVSFTAPGAAILVVDDLSSNLIVAEGLLAPYQARVSTASSGREAVLALERRDYDLVLLDHMMPGMDGIETVQVIRAMEEERFATLPVVAFTANALAGMREFFLENGFDDFMAKPIDVEELDRILRKWIPASKKGPPPRREVAAA
ncbi:MAG: response regulator [Deltaproteobacteria bacterium]|jgi:signal transduction histidine kinase/AmiR/NasT family two-component response regulator|nr:response regulator [Deltaproteobacteria bacterium]